MFQLMVLPADEAKIESAREAFLVKLNELQVLALRATMPQHLLADISMNINGDGGIYVTIRWFVLSTLVNGKMQPASPREVEKGLAHARRSLSQEEGILLGAK